MQTQESNLFTFLANWPVEPASTLTPMAGGTNNRAWVFTAEDGLSYVLRLAAGTNALNHTRTESALLAALRDIPLPFHLPFPLLTRTGNSLLQIEQDNEQPAIATLTPLLPGKIPARTVENSAIAATALGRLDAALSTIPIASLPASNSDAAFYYGDLTHCHPLIADPFIEVERLLPADQARSMIQILQKSLCDWQRLTDQTLPWQIIHRDYGPGNMLMEREQVSAILDFEFAGADRRIFDLCVAISWWPVRLMETGNEWEMIDAIGRAYTAEIPLTEAELRILPATLRMRDTTSLIYRIGRHLAGLETIQTIQERVQHSLWRETWLQANQRTLLQHALNWQQHN